MSFAYGKGAAQVRKDFGRKPGDELTFCTAPRDTAGANGEPDEQRLADRERGRRADQRAEDLRLRAARRKGRDRRRVRQGGDQESVDGKVVYPGQKVEYQLTTQPNLPAGLAYQVSKSCSPTRTTST